ncbi:hypothetical protein ACS0TY_013094 [Phlomoides rotata]
MQSLPVCSRLLNQDYVVISDDHIHPTPTISAKVRALFLKKSPQFPMIIYSF